MNITPLARLYRGRCTPAQRAGVCRASSSWFAAAWALTGALVLGAALGLAPAPASAQSLVWPKAQPIKLVAVFPPGGSVDQVARILQPALQSLLQQTVVVDNRGGASGSIGTGQVAKAEPDGYTFAVVFDTHAVNPALLPSLPFDTRRDLAPVIMIGTSAMVLAAHVDSPYKTFGDAVSAARTRNGVPYGTIGNGSLGHLAVSLLARAHNLGFQHVPYRGGGPLMNDAVAGHVPVSIGSVFLLKPHIDSGKLRPLAVTTNRRVAALANVPTVSESGFAGFDAPAWWAVVAPARTPPDVLRQMNEALNAALRQPDVAARLAGQGIEVRGGSADAARSFIEGQIDTWAKVVRENDIKAD
ncbi:MAG: tripartite tricarboxylate transporter substrate binding protein [Burkholderiaceae bacterium]